LQGNNANEEVMSSHGGFDVEALAQALRAQDPAAAAAVVSALAERGAEQSVALEAVALAFYSDVMPFIRRRVGQDPERADEVWSDTLLRVYKRAGTYDRKRSQFRTWVFNQAHYAALDSARRARARAETPVARLPEQYGGDDLALPLTASDQRALRRAMKRLTPTERQLLWCRHVLGMLPSEIATSEFATELPAEHIRVYLSRAADKLRRLYLAEKTETAKDPLMSELI
jgi:RNA polymerase sigma-70 factor (ECF subfamily)